MDNIPSREPAANMFGLPGREHGPGRHLAFALSLLVFSLITSPSEEAAPCDCETNYGV